MSRTVSAVSITTATALTVDNVCTALKTLEGRVMGTGGLADYLRTPKQIQDKIARNHPNPPDQLREVVSYYLTRHPSPSWRGVICAVEWIGVHHVADGIRERAEPVRGMQYRECGGGSVGEGVWGRECGGGSLREGVWGRECAGGSVREGVWGRECGGGSVGERVWGREFEGGSVGEGVWGRECGGGSVREGVWGRECGGGSVREGVWGRECDGGSVGEGEVWLVVCGQC